MKDSSKDGGAAEADKRAVGLMMTSAAAAIKDGVVAEAGERAVGSMVTTESQGGVRAAKDGGSRGGYSSEDSAASAAATASRPHGMRSAAAMAKAAAEEDSTASAAISFGSSIIYGMTRCINLVGKTGRNPSPFLWQGRCVHRGVLGPLREFCCFFVGATQNHETPHHLKADLRLDH